MESVINDVELLDLAVIPTDGGPVMHMMRPASPGKSHAHVSLRGFPPSAPPSGGRIGRRRVADARKRGRKTLP